MKIDIAKNASRNIIFSVIKKIYIAMISFVMRTLMIYLLGIEYAGLNGVFTSLLNVLNLAELGAGTAIVYSMYKPIAEEKQQKICELMQMYKTCYRVVGFAILVLGLLCLPFLNKWITGTIPANLNIHILFLLHLLTTVCSYCFFSYKSSILSAHQRTDVESKVNILVSTIRVLAQIIILFSTRNYYLYLTIELVMVLMKNAIVSVLAERIYPTYKACGMLPYEEKKEIYKNVIDIFLSKIGGVVVNSVDTIVISSILGITILGIYQNYYFIVSSVSGMVVILYRSCIAGIGNRMALGKTDEMYESFENMSFWLIWICSFCCSCFLGVFQPFIQVWVGKEMLLEYGIVVLLCVFFYIFQIMGLYSVYEDSAGIWRYDRFRPLLEAILNLILNLVMVRFIGLYGILLSTVISMACFSLPWLVKNIFDNMFFTSIDKYVFKMIKWNFWAILPNIIIGIACINNHMNTIWEAFIRIVIYIVLQSGYMFLLYRKAAQFQWMTRLVQNIMK